MDAENLIEVATPRGCTVRYTRRYWEFIVTHKHPVLRDRGAEIAQVLGEPDEIRRSRKDPTDVSKTGETIWTRPRVRMG